MSLSALVESIIADGVVDDQEALDFETQVYLDGEVERDEADAAFAINNAVSGAANSPEWERVFVRVVTDYVLQDDTTPGIVDDDEAAYLIENIEGDDNVDPIERALLVNIRSQATAISPLLTEKLTEYDI